MSIEIKSRWTGAVIKVVEGYSLRGANLYGASLVGADLVGANLVGASLGGANLYVANLCEANLYGVDLYGANLVGANLYGADLTRADLGGANLVGANLVGAKRYIDGDKAITLRGPRPILQIGPLGSRDGYMMALLTSAGLRIECGCFCGTLERFEAKIRESHADNPRHRDEYLAVCRMIKAWAKAELKFADKWEKENPMPVDETEVDHD